MATSNYTTNDDYDRKNTSGNSGTSDSSDTSGNSGDTTYYTLELYKDSSTTILKQGTKKIINDKSYLLESVEFHKEIYRPGCLEFTIQSNSDIFLLTNNIKNKLVLVYDKKVNLKYGEDIVAKNYCVFEKKTKGKFITYKAYSPDKFLTIDKFNYAHTGKRLVDPLIINQKPLTGGIVFSLLNAPKEGSALKKFKDLVLNNNAYYVKNLNHLGTGNDEAILPYCVQYQESFFDFMVRICNRCGEFLYCENNEWHIGRAEIKDDKDKEIIASLTEGDVQSEEKYESCCDIEGMSIGEVSNYLKEEYVKNIMSRDTTKPVVNNAGMLSEEYFESIDNGNYAHYSDYLPPLSTTFDFLKAAGERQNFFDAAASTLVAGSMKFSVAGKFMSDMNKNYDDYYGALTDTEDGGKKHEFTRIPNKVDATFYANILKGEEYAEKNKLILEFSTYRHLLLGQRVKYKGDYYVVYGVNGGITDNNTECQTVTLVPVQAEGKVFPLPLYDKHIKKASPQRAVVVFNFDPERLGRVRVKYPWQTIGTAGAELEGLDNEQKEKKKKQNKLADATPWLRVSYPMASKESGFMFFPKEGDEVLIDYEDGNIDRPFVAGSFYNKENRPSVPSATHMVGLTKSITSDNGHHISFTDLSGDKFLGNMIPIASLLSKFGVEIPISNQTDLIKYLGGGFEIADYLGIYSIKGSSHERKISISSPVGDVVVDAFTGITINAPHGDVNIVGKNVNIEARNNLTIQSGTNIKQAYFWHRDEFLKTAVGRTGITFGVAVSKALGLDLSFHRTWLEVLVRPIGGTMLIKSYRFMRLEAGDGETRIEKRTSGSEGKLKTLGKAIIHRAFESRPEDIKNDIPNIILNVKQAFQMEKLLFEQINVVKEKVNNYRSCIGNYKNRLDKIKKCFEKGLDDSDYNSLLTTDAIKVKLRDMDISLKRLLVLDEEYEKIDISSETWNGLNQKMCNNLKNLEKWMKNNGEGNLQVSAYQTGMDNKEIREKCLFEVLQDYVQKHAVLKDLITLDENGDIYIVEQNRGKKIWNFLNDRVFGTADMIDQNIWSERDKGGILVSVNKQRAFDLADDGTFKQYDDIIEVIKSCIRNF